MRFIEAPIIIGICVLGIYKLFELFARRRERILLIEKLSENFSGEKINLTLPNLSQGSFSYGSLKIGCLLAGLGAGILVGFIISSNYIPDYFAKSGEWEYRNLSNIIYGSCVLLFGGIGLIIAFIIELNLDKKKKEE